MSFFIEYNSNNQDLVELLWVRPSKPILSWNKVGTWVLLLPFLATAAVLHAATIGVSANGTCYAGSCPPTVLAGNATETLPIDFTITLADGDSYLINGTFGGSRSENVNFSTSHDFQVTYEGNANGGPSHDDSVTVEAEYAFATSPGSSTTAHRTLLGAFARAIASSSSASSCVNGTLGCLGPAVPPHSFNLSATT